jgi:hypothetical protein
MVLNEALQMLIKHSVQTKAEIDGALSLNTKDVESICGAEAGFLDSRVVPFAIRRKD